MLLGHWESQFLHLQTKEKLTFRLITIKVSGLEEMISIFFLLPYSFTGSSSVKPPTVTPKPWHHWAPSPGAAIGLHSALWCPWLAPRDRQQRCMLRSAYQSLLLGKSRPFNKDCKSQRNWVVRVSTPKALPTVGELGRGTRCRNVAILFLLSPGSRGDVSSEKWKIHTCAPCRLAVLSHTEYLMQESWSLWPFRVPHRGKYTNLERQLHN